MSRIPIEVAARSLSELIERAAKGENVIITSGALPIARLVAVPGDAGHPTFGSARGLITISADFDEPIDDLREYEE